MPTKDRTKRQRQKEQYAQNNAEMKQKSRQTYAANSEDRKHNVKVARLCVSYKNRQKKNNRISKRRSLADEDKRTQHQATDRQSKRKSRADEKKRAQHQVADRERKRKLMADEKRRAQRRAVVRDSEARRKACESYRTKRIQSASSSRKCRLQNDAEYQKQYREVSHRNQMQRLRHDVDYKNRNRQNAHRNQLRRLNSDLNFRNKNRDKAKERSKRLISDHRNRLYKTQWMRVKRQTTTSPVQIRHRPTTVTSKQLYWIQRRRRIAEGRQMNKNWLLVRKMCQQSAVSELDVKLLFNKAQKTIKKAELKARIQHQKLALSAEQCLKHFADDAVSEEAVDAAYSERYHNASTEPYYWERAYRALSDINVPALPVDDSGRVHVFGPVTVTKNSERPDANAAEPECDEAQGRPSVKSWRQWQCNPAVCRVTDDLVTGLVTLLYRLVGIRRTDACTEYEALDSCSFGENSGKLGHMVYCSAERGCHNGSLNAARALSCHYPQLRSQIRRLYEVRSMSKMYKRLYQEVTSRH